MIRLRSLIAVLLSLVLLGAQQMAFAHMIGHLSGAVGAAATATTATMGDDAGHGDALGLSHACTTCVGVSALNGAAPLGTPAPLALDNAIAAPVSADGPRVAAGVSHLYHARAPPLGL
jgi:hypothetical protein